TFVLPPTAPGATYRSRIFTPGGELAFAGHPTLGTAAALALAGKVAGTDLVQETLSGLTPITLHHQGAELDRVVMQAPEAILVDTPDPDRVARALNLTPGDVTPGGLKPAVIAAGVRHMIVPVASPEALAAIQPDTGALTALSRELGIVGAYPFALLPAGGGAHTRARLFAPLYGIPEDPATGSAAAPLGAYLLWNGLLPSGGSEFWYEQGGEIGRPSRLWVKITGADRLVINVGGQVKLVGRGEFYL
ncbi:MAG TPA: PhzF family phenazine biosynthesis protein, partial [Symbiobacteriaceae bacterium]|nr:PhzF family phenazine biosynthesis protein [Symbiobacteriaceae bacterium]